MEINIQSNVGECTEFLDDKGNKGEISVVIAPLKVTTDEDGSKIKVVTGCNMWQSCHNGGCYYSLTSHRTKKA